MPTPTLANDDARRARAKTEAQRRIDAGDFTTQEQVDSFMAAQGIAPLVAGGGGRSGGPGMGGPAAASRVASDAGLTAGETLRGAGRAALQGLTAQFGDELEAGVRTGSLSGPRYQAVRDSLRDEQARFAAEYPKTNLAAELAGGIAPVVGATLATGGAAAPAAAARLLPSMARGAAVGAGYGAATGAGMAAEREDIPAAAITGAMAGGALGMALPAGGALASGVGRAGANFFDRATRELAESGGLMGRGAQRAVPALDARAARIAEERILKALRDDGLTPAQAAERLALMQSRGVPAAVVDAGEENLLETLNTSFLVPGPGRRTAAQYARERMAGTPGRLAEQLEKVSGAKLENLNTVLTRIRTERAAPAAQLYRQAFANAAPLQLDETANTLLTSPFTGDLRKAWGEGLRRAMLDETVFKNLPAPMPMFRTVTREGGEKAVELMRAPTVRDIDFIKRGLDAEIQKAVKLGDGELTRLLTGTKNALLQQADDQVPAYRAAREFWAGEEALMGALERGKRFLRGGEDDFADAVSAMTPDELVMYRRGAANSLAESLRKRDGRLAAVNVLTDPTAQARLRAIFPDEESFAMLKRVVEDEVKGTAPFARMTRQSQTAQNVAGLAELVDNAGAMAMDPKSAALMQLLQATRGNTEAVAGQTARFLTQQGPEAIEYLRRLSVQPTRFQQARGAATGAGAQGILGGRFGGSMGANR
jgi:hypothetical protein